MKTGRSTYHHGDLRNALISAGAKLAERGGAGAIGVRAAAREVGVTPTAAYRHFAGADDLIGAVKARAFQTLVDAMEHQLSTVPDDGDPGQRAVQRLAALGRAYVRVGIAEPGLYEVAFGAGGSTVPTDEAPPAFGMLLQALDDLVSTGLLPAERRPLAEVAVWGAVHGLVRLMIDQQVEGLSGEALEVALQRCVEMVLYGVAAGTTIRG